MNMIYQIIKSKNFLILLLFFAPLLYSCNSVLKKDKKGLFACCNYNCCCCLCLLKCLEKRDNQFEKEHPELEIKNHSSTVPTSIITPASEVVKSPVREGVTKLENDNSEFCLQDLQKKSEIIEIQSAKKKPKNELYIGEINQIKDTLPVLLQNNGEQTTQIPSDLLNTENLKDKPNDSDKSTTLVFEFEEDDD